MLTDVLQTLIPVLTGGGLVAAVTAISHRRANKRMAEALADKEAAAANSEEWQLWKSQLDRMNEQIAYKDKLLAEKETRFADQTDRLRETQNREAALNAEILRLTHEVQTLELQLKDHRCVKLTCAIREPENEHSRIAKAQKVASRKKPKKNDSSST